MHSAYLSSNSRNWETQDRRNKNTHKVLPGCYLNLKQLSVDVSAAENHHCAEKVWIVSPQQWVAAGRPLLHPSAESALHSLRHAGNTAENKIYPVLLLPYCISWWISMKNVQRVYRFNKDKWFHTSLTFFWRSTICERRCVISSCCREASSLFRASSSDRDVICRLELPGMAGRIRIWPKDPLLMMDLRRVPLVLTQFFDTVVDKLLLLFLIRDCFCLQVARLMQNKQICMPHC